VSQNGTSAKRIHEANIRFLDSCYLEATFFAEIPVWVSLG
jgi:hypothetical protein